MTEIVTISSDDNDSDSESTLKECRYRPRFLILKETPPCKGHELQAINREAVLNLENFNNIINKRKKAADNERDNKKMSEAATRSAEEVVEGQKNAEEDGEEPAAVVKDVVRSKGKGVKRKSGDISGEKVNTKAGAAAEKQAKKQKMEEERQAKKAADERNKMYKPGECMKYMQVEGHPTLWSRWYMSDVGRELSAAGARAHSSAALCDPAVLVWTRSRTRALEAGGGQVRLSPAASRCDLALYIASAEEVCELVSSHSLSPHMARVQQLCDCRVTLVLFKLDDYFKSNRRKTSNSNRSPMNEIDLELALTDLLVTTNCDTVKVNTPNELALRIVQFTKAIAEAPFKKTKRDCDKQAESYLRGDNKNCVALGKDGAGNSRLWQQMIAVLPQYSLETARALCAQYPTPLKLYQALQSDGPGPLAALSVPRGPGGPGGAGGPGPAGRARRLGPELARRLHALFTEQDGELCLA